MRRVVVLLTGCLLLSGLCWGATIYVKPDGTGDAPTIAAGLAAAGVGDTLLLASGTFTGAGNQDITIPDRNLTIMSQTGNPAHCVIDFERNYGFYVEDGTAVIQGITMTNAIWSALRVWTSIPHAWIDLNVRDCVFSNCEGDGSGINVDCYGDVTITGCRFQSNIGMPGGAVYLGARGGLEALIDRCTFCDNSADYGAAITCSTMEVMASIANSIFYNNSAVEAGGAIALVETNADITGCTFFANSAPNGSAISGGYWPSVTRCVLAYGMGGCALTGLGEPWDPELSCIDIYGNEGGDWTGPIAGFLGRNGNFSTCPSFCNRDIEPYDLHLCSASPCLPGNHPDGSSCGLIGALGQGCGCGPSAVEPTTWGALKAMRR